MIESKLLFTDRVFSESYKDKIDNQKIIDFAAEYKKQNPEGHHRSNMGGWQHPVTRGMCEELDKVIALAERTVFEITRKHFLLNEFVRFSNAWFNQNKKGDHNSIHTHPGATMAGVYYVNQKPEYGAVTFHRCNNFEYGIDAHLHESYLASPWCDTQFKTIYDYMPEESNFICFPAFLEHAVRPNTTDDERLIVAMNFHVEGNLRNNVL